MNAVDILRAVSSAIDPRDIYRPYVESLARECLGLDGDDDLTIEHNGDIPIRIGSALYRITLLDHDPVLVRVWARVLVGVELSLELLEEINDINRGIISARVFYVPDDDTPHGKVVAATEIPAASMDRDDLAHACEAIASLSDWVDTTMMVRFGGATAFADDDDT